ncbi:ACP S-malonyltransferase [Phycicoccus duodecadis]|uniref:[acyl-carrier-protein] S-malonyltransferase n=1 Tax=Phycicoccus duodecadis TaxID=173053 RepID=A0A2N3YN00_9MICO|nr:ACP S-malonyltransferase [Phycicoccus duodecadis]PKW28241.1 [acyl-carrier-protein] S-malonyltransferase [Phycicoccus duodecadis]
MIVIVCPGQGSQTPGFLSPWLELPGTREHLGALADAAQVDLVAHGTTSDEETIKDTAVAQPLLVGAGLLTLRALGGPAGAGALSGHSVGEITAAAGAGVLAEDDAMRLVALRGRGMAEASAATPTGMSAVLGGDPDEVLAAVASHGLTPANVNGAGQVVAAGALDALAALAAEPPTRARVIPLKVAGAFHTSYMQPAVDALAAAAAGLSPADATVPLVSNRDGEIVTDGREVLNRLVAQVSNPVRWDLCMERFATLGVTALIELAPAGTLVGLAKRALKGVELLALKSPDDLEAARTLVQEHSA